MRTATASSGPVGGPAGTRGTPRELAGRLVPFLPAAPVLLAWILWSHHEGGYFQKAWYASALGALVVLATMVIARGRALPAGQPVRLALGLLVALVGWAYLSLLWSAAPGDGLAAANKLLLVLLCAWILALLPWTATSASAMLGVWVAGVTGVCVISLLAAQGTAEVGDFFIEGRYLDPIGYANGVSALPAMALFPAVRTRLPARRRRSC